MFRIHAIDIRSLIQSEHANARLQIFVKCEYNFSPTWMLFGLGSLLLTSCVDHVMFLFF